MAADKAPEKALAVGLSPSSSHLACSRFAAMSATEAAAASEPTA